MGLISKKDSKNETKNGPNYLSPSVIEYVCPIGKPTLAMLCTRTVLRNSGPKIRVALHFEVLYSRILKNKTDTFVLGIIPRLRNKTKKLAFYVNKQLKNS
jgi:hypothetical protein